jgi:hypothetical protein
MSRERELITLCTVENPIEASVLESLLTDQEIPAVIETWESKALDGIFVQQKGYARLKVFRDDHERAQEVLADFQAAAKASPEPEPGD